MADDLANKITVSTRIFVSKKAEGLESHDFVGVSLDYPTYGSYKIYQLIYLCFECFLLPQMSIIKVFSDRYQCFEE